MVGYMPWESELVGVPFDERGAMMDEHIDAMIELWTADEPRFEGKYVSFKDIVFDPKPVQQPLPLWFGARTKPALRRIARVGDGWAPSGLLHEEIPGWLDYIRSQPSFQARPRPLEVFTGFSSRPFLVHETPADYVPPPPLTGKDEILERLGYLSSLGVTSTSPAVAGGARTVSEYLEQLQWFAEEIMPAARAI
jgi:hypothetical protein